MSRDPLGLWGDPGQRGNGQSYCGNNPVNFADPMGLSLPSPEEMFPIDEGWLSGQDEYDKFIDEVRRIRNEEQKGRDAIDRNFPGVPAPVRDKMKDFASRQYDDAYADLLKDWKDDHFYGDYRRGDPRRDNPPPDGGDPARPPKTPTGPRDPLDTTPDMDDVLPKPWDASQDDPPTFDNPDGPAGLNPSRRRLWKEGEELDRLCDETIDAAEWTEFWTWFAIGLLSGRGGARGQPGVGPRIGGPRAPLPNPRPGPRVSPKPNRPVKDWTPKPHRPVRDWTPKPDGSKPSPPARDGRIRS